MRKPSKFWVHKYFCNYFTGIIADVIYDDTN